MNINFSMAMNLLNTESYDKAEEYLRKAIDEEKAEGNERTAAEFTCVLGELLARLEKDEAAAVEFEKVLGYCRTTSSLEKQREIAEENLAEIRRRNTPNSTQSSDFAQ